MTTVTITYAPLTIEDSLAVAALVFKAADQSVAERFAANDPHVTVGLVTNWTVRKWTVVVEAVP